MLLVHPYSWADATVNVLDQEAFGNNGKEMNVPKHPERNVEGAYLTMLSELGERKIATLSLPRKWTWRGCLPLCGEVLENQE